MRDYEFYYTEDGSIGLYSYAVGDVYHSKFGALSEAWTKFILPSDIETILSTKKHIKVLDICYGIGYNTKALMSFVLNFYEKKFCDYNLKNKKKFLKNFLLKIDNTETIYNNNITTEHSELLSYIETILDDNIATFSIDCIEQDESLIKISPLLKTIKSENNFFKKNFTKEYKSIKSIFEKYPLFRSIKKFLFFYGKRNPQFITELLNLKFNDFIEINPDYKVNRFVNKIIIDNLCAKYEDSIIDEKTKLILSDKHYRKYFDHSMFRYMRFYSKFLYKIIHIHKLKAFLHNIYYRYLSKRHIFMNKELANDLFKLVFFPNDARKVLPTLKNQYDLIFLDAFTYSIEPQLWSVEFFKQLYDKLSPNGKILTYSNAAAIRKSFIDNKFYIGKIKDDFSGKFVGTIAVKNKSLIKYPLNNYEMGLCSTKAGIPYHDETLSLSKREILKKREYEFKNTSIMSVSKYKKMLKERKEGLLNEKKI